MSETKKLHEHGKTFSGMRVPTPNSKPSSSEASSTVGQQTSELDNLQAPKANKPVDPSRSGNADEDGIGEFAESVASGLELAGLEVEGNPEEPIGLVAEGGETSEAFFAGWDGEPGEIAEASSLPYHDQQRDQTRGHQTLTEMGLATGRMGAAYLADVASKHDELADAVQSALLSVYGDPNAQPQGAAGHSLGGNNGRSSGQGWASAARVPSSGVDQLSPEDVILNYFEYDSAAGRAPVQGRKEGYGSWAYDGPPTYSVPAAISGARRASQEKKGGRLLGAAAVGLIGGVAIAATLAVFVIKFYGPEARSITAPANASQDFQDMGYGDAQEAPTVSKLAFVEPGTLAAEDVVATAGQPVALAISAKALPQSDQTLVNITGVPPGTRLNTGIDAGGGSWLLSPRRLQGLMISLPPGTPRTVPLEVQLLDGNARTPLSEKRQFVVRLNPSKPDAASYAAVTEGPSVNEAAGPSSKDQAAPHLSSFDARTIAALAAPNAPSSDSNFKTQTVTAAPQQPFPAAIVQGSENNRGQGGPAPDARKTQSKAEVEDLIREGNKRMREGDILEARQLYQRAIALGDPEAALAMGRSFDPIYFARIDKKNAEPDPAKAFDWYRRAMDGGAVQTAKVRIENLKHFLSE